MHRTLSTGGGHVSSLYFTKVMPYKVDFHTHSYASPDGSLTAAHYRRMIENGGLDYIAITDHNTIDTAQALYSELGGHIIVGEEIMTRDGEIIGLFLGKVVPSGMSAKDTVRYIQKQGGLVYIPHPFETVRKGLTIDTLNAIAKDVDIIEGYNGRAVFQNFTKRALAWAEAHQVPVAAASDAHGRAGWGRTYTIVEQKPTRDNLVGQLKAKANLVRAFPGVRGLLYPKVNRWSKRKRHA